MSTGTPPGALPGFEWRRRGRDRMLVNRDFAEEMGRLLPLVLDLRNVPGAVVLPGGRGATLAAPVREGVRAVLRRNLRGGLPARFVRDVYLGWGARPFREVAAAERLRAAGVPVPESFGAIVRRVAFAFYRGAVATRAIENSVNLWVDLERTPDAEARRAACRAAPAIVRATPVAGAVPPDLNLQNFLVQRGDGAMRLWLIDCDGVEFRPTTETDWRNAVDRMRRSSRRLDPGGVVVDPTWFDG